MKALRFLFFAFAGIVGVATASMASETLVPSNKLKVNLTVGTTTSFTGVAIAINLKQALPAHVLIDRAEFAATRDALPRFELRDEQNNFAFELDKGRAAAAETMLQLVEQRTDVIEALSNRRNYIFIDKPLKIKLTNGDYLVITPKVLKEATLAELELTEKDREMWVEARGGAHTLYQNKIDFGMRSDAADSSRKEFVLTFSYFGVPVQSAPWWSVAAKGQLSTNKQDPLSKLAFFPLTVGRWFGLDEGGMFSTGELRAWIGLEGDQPLNKTRINGSFTYTTILPNIIDLTFGDQRRLRLKPVIKVSAEYWNEINDDRVPDNLQKGGRIGCELYYFIPVMERYSFLIEGNVGFILGDTFKKKHNADDVVSRFDVTLGYEVAGADLKVLAKYSFGQNDINFQRDDRLLLGLAIDLFKTIGGAHAESGTK